MKISVIIPAYNCAEFIGDTIYSLKAQTLKDFEVIIVNDGSTDNTLEILNEFKEKDERIRVITVKNGGPSKARNIGIDEAQGEYLYFMDSDDTIADNMFSELYEAAEKYDLDEVTYAPFMDDISKKQHYVTELNHEPFIAHKQTEFRAKLMGLIKAYMMNVVWNKLFKAELIKENKIYYDGDIKNGEDRLFNMSVFKHISRFAFINKPFYHYYLRGEDTLNNKYLPNRFDGSLRYYHELLKAFEEMNILSDKNRSYINFIFIKGVMSCFTQLCVKSCPLKFKEKKRYIGEILAHPAVDEAIRTTDDEISYSKHVNRILRTKNKTLIYLMAKGIYLMQFKFNHIFQKMKHRKEK